MPVKLLRPNGWTGAQYSVFRAVLGTYLAVHFVRLLPWAEELWSSRGVLPDPAASPFARLLPNLLALPGAPLWLPAAFVAAGALLCVPLALGAFDRVAAVLLWYVWACLFGRNPLISNPGMPFVGWMLLAHALMPRAPYGSLARRGDPDPGTGWEKPPLLHAGAWVLMALGYTYSGWTKLASPSWIDGSAIAFVLDSPLARPGVLHALLLALPAGVLRAITWTVLGLELGFAPLALLRPLRPLLWAALLGLHIGLIALVDFADLSVGMVLLHLFTFDPAWIPGAKPGQVETLFYDGACGLCHRAVRFVIAEDRGGSAFRFAPIQGETLERLVPAHVRAVLPDSLVVRTAEGVLLFRSAAVLYVGRRLGGAWRLGAGLVAALPVRWCDGLYEAIARVRGRVFARPKDACPVMPKELRARFDP